MISPHPCFVFLKSDFKNGDFMFYVYFMYEKILTVCSSWCHFSSHFYMNVCLAYVVLNSFKALPFLSRRNLFLYFWYGPKAITEDQWKINLKCQLLLLIY